MYNDDTSGSVNQTTRLTSLMKSLIITILLINVSIKDSEHSVHRFRYNK